MAYCDRTNRFDPDTIKRRETAENCQYRYALTIGDYHFRRLRCGGGIKSTSFAFGFSFSADFQGLRYAAV